MNMSRRKAITITGAVAILAVALGLFIQTDPFSLRKGPSADWVFELSYPDPAGVSRPLKEGRGPFTLVNLWATWCAPCVEEMPELSRLHTEVRASGLSVMGLAVDSPSNVRSFLASTPVSYPVYVVGGAGSELSKRLGAQVDALPFTVIIDSQGRIVRKKLGKLSEDELKMWVKELKLKALPTK